MRVSGFLAVVAGAVGIWVTALALPLLASGAAATPQGEPEAGTAAPMAPVPERVRNPAETNHAVGPGPGPAEPPPPGFAGVQYIDSAGCVFLNLQGQWRPRVGRDGAVLCGYPPTLSARRTMPDAAATLMSVPAEPRAARIERVLSETIIGNLQEGELLAPEAKRPAPAASAGPVQAAAAGQPARAAAAVEKDLPDLTAAAEAGLAVRAGMAQAEPSTALCRLLGASEGAARSVRLGQQMALGRCGAEPLPIFRIAAAAGGLPDGQRGRVDGTGPASPAPGPRTSAPVGVRPDAAKPARVKARQDAAAPDPKTARTGQVQARAPSRAPSRVIPPGARFVQIGTYADASSATRAAQVVARLGLPVSMARETRRGTTVQTIMAGPFDGRGSIVRAIDRIHRAGYPGAYAR